VLNECVADTALALILNTLRRLPQSEKYLRGGNWASRGPYPLTTSLGGKVLGCSAWDASAKRWRSAPWPAA
jgi:lactate dehydrogenase-like 2-hydroxyacid dehydrogenase